MSEANTLGPPAADLANRSRFKDMVRSLKHRNFQLFFSGQLISLIGTWMDTIASRVLRFFSARSRSRAKFPSSFSPRQAASRPTAGTAARS